MMDENTKVGYLLDLYLVDKLSKKLNITIQEVREYPLVYALNWIEFYKNLENIRKDNGEPNNTK